VIEAFKEKNKLKQPENKCNPHPKAPHGFNRNASHANDRYTCECESWDAYEAGYQDGVTYYEKVADDLQALCDKQSLRIAELETQPEQEPVAWEYDVTYNQDGTVSVALPDGDELRIVLPNQQEPVSLPVKLPWDDNPEKHPYFYTWTWDVMVSGGKWRAEYGWKKPTQKVVNLQPLYTTPPQRKPLTDEQIINEADRFDWDKDCAVRFARAIEAAHGIKE
jgi:hypothetical protein